MKRKDGDILGVGRQGGPHRWLSPVALYYVALPLLFTAFFEIWRLLLLAFLRDMAAGVPAGVLARAFLVGARFDFSMACYLTLPILLIGAVPGLDIRRSRTMRAVSVSLTLLLAAAAFFGHIADIEFVRNFNTRLNGMALEWGETPGMIVSMIWGMFPVARYLLLLVAMLALFTVALRGLLRRFVTGTGTAPVAVNVVWLLAVAAVLVLGGRGRIERKAVLRWGAAYFSEYDFANQLALNPIHTFLRDAVYDRRYRRDVEESVVRYLVPDHESVTRALTGRKGTNGERIRRRIQPPRANPSPPNVVLIVMESFGSTKIGALDNRYPVDLSPNFDRMAKEGILFTDVYSTGMHTYAGLFSTIWGHPPFPGDKIFRTVTGSRRFWGLPSILRDHGYRTTLFITHDPLFDNLQGFFMANGFMGVISSLDYPRAEWLSTWGVPDHVMFDRAVVELRQQALAGRFFATILTTSNHGPWILPDVPYPTVPTGTPKEKELNAFRYSDWSLGRFWDALRSDPAFANTLVVVTSDNGALFEPTLEMDLSHYRIPLLIVNTSGMREPRRIGGIASQLDIVDTAMGFVGLPYDDFTYGRDLMAERGTGGAAYLYEWYKVAWLEEGKYLIRHLKEPERSFWDVSGARPVPLDKESPAASEYERRALSFMQTAYFNSAVPLPVRAGGGTPQEARR